MSEPIGYAVIEYNQASGWPSFNYDDTIHTDLDAAEDALDYARAEMAKSPRHERYAIVELRVVEEVEEPALHLGPDEPRRR